MFRRRLTIALFLVTLGMSVVFLIPDSFGLREAAVFKALPMQVGDWQGRSEEPSKQELNLLARDTTFSKRLFYRKSPRHVDKFEYVAGTLVLSGDDMNNSIHRPERCLPSQGFGGIERTELDIDVGHSKPLKVSRLEFSRTLADGKEIPSLMYYWFVGADYLTNDHYARTLYDMKFRILEGTNQRWAYISFSTTFGESRGDQVAPSTEAETDEILAEMIKDTFDAIHKTEKLKGWVVD